MNDRSENCPTRVRERKSGKVRRQEILEAIARLLGQEQMRYLSTREIAAEAGISEACLYRHFKSKAEMIIGLVEFCSQAFSAMFSEIDAVIVEYSFLEGCKIGIKQGYITKDYTVLLVGKKEADTLKNDLVKRGINVLS